jgi:hypothetical protein
MATVQGPITAQQRRYNFYFLYSTSVLTYAFTCLQLGKLTNIKPPINQTTYTLDTYSVER